MSAMRVAVIGGGPAGLTFARLARLAHPNWEVSVFERLPPGGTYGFGVGLGHRALARLRDADPVLFGAIEGEAIKVSTWTMERDGEHLSAANSHGLAISRSRLLGLLQEHALAAGVTIRTGGETALSDVQGADLVVGADGAGSAVRNQLAEILGASVRRGELAYLWCGAPISPPAMTLSMSNGSAGLLTAHVMPYQDGASTFQVDAHDDVAQALGRSSAPDQLATIEARYGHLLEGKHLDVKRLEWLTFPTVSCERWSTDNTVLIGDAAHTAHYTVGSGTGLAIEDAVALAAALKEPGSLAEAFETYEGMRRRRVNQLQDRAARSERWWSTLELRFEGSLAQLLVSYMTRTAAVTLPMLTADNEPLLERALGAPLQRLDEDSVVETILSQPFNDNGRTQPGRRFSFAEKGGATRTVEVNSANTSLAQVRAEAARLSALGGEGVKYLRLVGPADRDSLYTRLELAEHVGALGRVSTVVRGPREASADLALGVLSGRTDLVETED